MFKVLKNPFRPTAKGNYWTINLSSIPHELLLRQNTLVSRYAQDSGYRYRKDLSEVFDLSTGEIKVKIPCHLINQNAIRNRRSPLVDDPAAVMEAILLEETDDDNNSQNIQYDETTRFTLQDLFSQDENSEDEHRGRGRNSRNQKASSNMNMMNPSLAAYINQVNQAKSPYMNQVQAMQVAKESANTSNGNQMLPGLDRQMLAFQMLQNAMIQQQQPQQQQQNNAAALMAAQNALLTKAFSAKMSNPLLQNMLYAANQMNNQQQQKAQNETTAPDYAPPSDVVVKEEADNEQTNSPALGSVKSPVATDFEQSKRKKRKGMPVRRSSNDENELRSTSVPMLASAAVTTTFSPTSRSASCDADKNAIPGATFFSSPMTSSTSITTSSPHHDDSSEHDDQNNSQNGFIPSQAHPSSTHLSSFQNLALFTATSALQAGKMI